MFESLLIIPNIVIFGLLLGVARMFLPFGLLYALPVVALLAAAALAEKKKIRGDAAMYAITAAVGQWLSFLSWIFSRREVSDSGIAPTHDWGGFPSIATAGFPVRALEIPPPPLGWDEIPSDMWVGVFVDHLFWFLVAFAISGVLLGAWKQRRKKDLYVLAVVAFLGAAYNLAMLTFWFD
jgi:hypothetical protein